MPSLVVVTHPDKGSFCHALAAACVRGAKGKAVLRDLYASAFDPVLRLEEVLSKTSFDPLVQAMQAELRDASDLVLVFPEWWGGMPAMLKGWLDRVWLQGIAYDFVGPDDQPKTQEGLLSGLRVHFVIASDSPSPSRVPGSDEGIASADASGTALAAQWKNSVTPFSAARLERVLWCGPLRGSTWAQRNSWLETAAGLLAGAED